MLDILDKQLIIAIQDGLPLTASPYAEIAKQINQTEAVVIQRIKELQEKGIIKRLGVVVKHRALGFKANAMVVWNIPDTQVKELAHRLAGFDCITLCYQRPRRLPDWPYNLFTMIHGKDRDSVLKRLDDIVEILELQDIQHQPLFSTKQFKQRGGHYFKATPGNVIPITYKQKINKQNEHATEIQVNNKKTSSTCKNNSSLLKPLYG
jgi:siroheme decarboxylase